MPRTSIVAMLVAVEVVIAGIGLYALRGGHGFSMHREFSMRRDAWTATPIAPMAVGSAPEIQIDDPDSQVEVAASNDGLVHVTDRSAAGGPWSSSVPQLRVDRTAAGVSIVRPEAEHVVEFGLRERRTEVDVPPGSHVTIARCSGASVTGLRGGAEVHSQDGRIAMSGVRGQALVARSDDGSIHFDDVAANSIDAQSHDGRIDVSGIVTTGDAPHAVLHSDDGSVQAAGTFAPGGSYEISSGDGTVRIGLQRDADLTVDASTDDGTIDVDGTSQPAGDDDGAHHTIRLGNGSGNLRASSSDGSIHITTNGAV